MKNIKTNNFGEIKNFFKSLDLIYMPYLMFDKKDYILKYKLSNYDLSNKNKHEEFINYNGNKFKNNKLEIKYISPTIGYGLFACYEIKINDIIGEFCGTVTSNPDDISKCYNCSYFENDYETVISPRKIGNEMQFINHSDNPNCDWLRVIGNDNKYHILIVAIKDITIDEQLLINYGDEYWKALNIQPNKLAD